MLRPLGPRKWRQDSPSIQQHTKFKCGLGLLVLVKKDVLTFCRSQNNTNETQKADDIEVMETVRFSERARSRANVQPQQQSPSPQCEPKVFCNAGPRDAPPGKCAFAKTPRCGGKEHEGERCPRLQTQTLRHVHKFFGESLQGNSVGTATNLSTLVRTNTSTKLEDPWLHSF